ncbi:MAG: hypothetical protein DYG92_02840 [Leptolyngbya sp. PLA1]|nr:hypothetical protein [Leptolyngbya sp. PLA1]
MKTACSTVSVALALALAGSAAAQTVHSETFDQTGDYQGWSVNGQQMIFEGGENLTRYMGVPYLDFWGITLANDTAPELLGDLTRHGGEYLSLELSVRVSRFDNFFGDPMDPSLRPLVLQLIDEGNSSDPTDDVSVYFVGEGCPRQGEEWRTRRFSIPLYGHEALPAGWGGTGDEDPTTFEPRLPPGRTYGSVIRSVDRLQFTTLQPGYFYAPSFWEAGFDSVLVAPAPCDPDYNLDGNVDQDDVAYITNVIAGGPNPFNRDPDFNLDGTANQDDIEALINSVAGGACR